MRWRIESNDFKKPKADQQRKVRNKQLAES